MILLLLVVNKILSIICGMSQNSHFFLSFYVFKFNITAGNNRNNNNNNKYIYFHTKKKKHYQLHRIIIRQTNNKG